MFRYVDSDDSDGEGFELGRSNSESGYDEDDLKEPVDPKIRLKEAVIYGLLEEVDKLLQNGEVGPDDHLPEDWTPLMHAALSSRPDIVDRLLKAGADPNRLVEISSPLGCACNSPSSHEISNAACVKLLLERGAKADHVDGFGETPLMKAIKSGKTVVAQIMIPLVDLEQTDTRGKTAAFYAVSYNRPEILRMLINEGVNLRVEEKHGESLANTAEKFHHEEILDLLRDTDIFEDKEIEVIPVTFFNPTDDWRDIYPMLTDKNRLYSSDIAYILHGMYCERLIPLMTDLNITLHDLLTIDDKDTTKLNIVHPYLRKRLFTGIHKFHIHRWKPESVSLKLEPYDLTVCMASSGSHLKQITILMSTLSYLSKKIKDNASYEKFELNVNPLLLEINKIKKEIRKLKKIIFKMSQYRVPPGDYISKPTSNSIFTKKNTLLLIAVSLTSLFAFSKCYH